MTFAAAAEYWIAIWVATVLLVQLSSVARPLVNARSSARRVLETERPVQAGLFGGKDIR
jgi:hypothetical protein